MIDWMEYVKQAVEHQASDLFFIAGGPVCEKLDGRLCRLDSPRLLPPDTQQIVEDIYRVSNRAMDSYLQRGDDDFSFSIPNLARFRVNTYRQRNSMAAVIRIVSFDIKFALTVDKMYKKKLKEGALDGFTAEQIGTMEEICAFRAAEIKRLYDIHLSLCE